MRWEYKTLHFKKKINWRGMLVNTVELESEFNAMGRDGWELVNVIADTVSLVAMFKRAK